MTVDQITAIEGSAAIDAYPVIVVPSVPIRVIPIAVGVIGGVVPGAAKISPAAIIAKTGPIIGIAIVGGIAPPGVPTVMPAPPVVRAVVIIWFVPPGVHSEWHHRPGNVDIGIMVVYNDRIRWRFFFVRLFLDVLVVILLYPARRATELGITSGQQQSQDRRDEHEE